MTSNQFWNLSYKLVSLSLKFVVFSESKNDRLCWCATGAMELAGMFSRFTREVVWIVCLISKGREMDLE